MKFPVFLLLLLFLPLSASAQPPPGDSLLIISLQRDFDDVRRFSEEPLARWAELDPKTGLELWSDLEREALLEAVRNKDALLLIHGMGMPLSWSMRHYRRFSHHPLPYDLVIGIAWPAGEKKKSTLGNGLLYFGASARAKKAGKKLAALLESISAEAASLDVFTHSLGAKTALYSLKEGAAIAIDNLFLTAPAIGARSMKPRNRYGFATDKVDEKIFAFYSRKDSAFRFPANGKMGRRGMVGAAPDGKFVNVDCFDEVQSHSGYWQAGIVLRFLMRTDLTD
jgi:hypothetical protein